MDKYESSVWYVPPTETRLIARIQAGTVSLANLTSTAAVVAGVVQVGLAFGDLAANGCPVNGNHCVNVYAVSIPGVKPATFVSWFQAAAAARNALKRLPTNQEWQVAALGTTDAADDGLTTCAKNFGVETGSRTGCVSNVGAFDMVGNVPEWVAEWDELAAGDACGVWPNSFGADLSCIGGGGGGTGAGALLRGGSGSASSGVFSLDASAAPQTSSTVGFRCAR